MYRGITSKKLLNTWFFVFFWILTRKKCVFAGKFLAGLSIILSTCLLEHLQSKISECKSWKLEDFRIIFEVLGTMAENLFQGWQNSNRCPREQFMKFFFQKRKIRYFFRFWANVYFQRKLLLELRNPQSMFPWKFLGKNNFWNIYNLSHFFRTLIQKMLSRKENFFPRLSQLQSARPETFSEKKYFFLKKIVCSSVLEFEQLFLSTDKK